MNIFTDTRARCSYQPARPGQHQTAGNTRTNHPKPHHMAAMYTPGAWKAQRGGGDHSHMDRQNEYSCAITWGLPCAGKAAFLTAAYSRRAIPVSLPLSRVGGMAETSPGPPALPPGLGTRLRDLCSARGRGSTRPSSVVLTLGLAPCGREDGCTVRIMILFPSGNTSKDPRSANAWYLKQQQPWGRGPVQGGAEAFLLWCRVLPHFSLPRCSESHS